jgi:hypothetical protein
MGRAGVASAVSDDVSDWHHIPDSTVQYICQAGKGGEWVKRGMACDQAEWRRQAETGLVLGRSFPSTIRNSETIQHKAQGLRNRAQLHGSRIYTVIYCVPR